MAKATEYGLGPNTFPRGWFVVAESREIDVSPIGVTFFDRDFVIYRGESGNPVMLDAYCKHMGTHLGKNTSAMLIVADVGGKRIEGDAIRCPYHGWRYNSEGHVDDIPYHDGPCPKSASIRSYPVVDNMGCIMMWFDEQGNDPLYPPPYLQQWDEAGWVHWNLDHLPELDIHPQEVLDNMADNRHLGPTHGAPCEYFENEIKDHVLIQRQGGPMTLYGGVMLYTTTWYTGPGVLLSKQVWGDTTQFEMIANTPVSDGRIKACHGCLVKAQSETITEDDRNMARQVQAGALEAFSKDFEIWQHKAPALRPMAMKTEGPFLNNRKWYGAFYGDAGSELTGQTPLNGLYHVPGVATPAQREHAIDHGIPI